MFQIKEMNTVRRLYLKCKLKENLSLTGESADPENSSLGWLKQHINLLLQQIQKLQR